MALGMSTAATVVQVRMTATCASVATATVIVLMVWSVTSAKTAPCLYLGAAVPLRGHPVTATLPAVATSNRFPMHQALSRLRPSQPFLRRPSQQECLLCLIVPRFPPTQQLFSVRKTTSTGKSFTCPTVRQKGVVFVPEIVSQMRTVQRTCCAGETRKIAAMILESLFQVATKAFGILTTDGVILVPQATGTALILGTIKRFRSRSLLRKLSGRLRNSTSTMTTMRPVARFTPPSLLRTST
mmetsp:Transcript_45402/g.67418  ORF Transcript_45402/g.67418 Transcript_45402/m.67418 type:complete len:241 (-) Transcript_45402:249-971(-)